MTSHIGSKELYVTSGHYDKYGESSFQPIQVPSENEEYLYLVFTLWDSLAGGV